MTELLIILLYGLNKLTITTGTYGDLIYFLRSLFQSTFFNQGCFLTSSKPKAPNRLAGFLINIYINTIVLY